MNCGRHKIVFLLVSLLSALTSQPLVAESWLNKQINKGREAIDRGQQKLQQTQERMQERVQEVKSRQQQFAEQTRERFQHFGHSAGAVSQGLDRVFSQYGEGRAAQLADSLRGLGPKSVEIYTACFEKYGSNVAATQRIWSQVSNKPEAWREKILAAYQHHDLELGDRVAQCYQRYGARAVDLADGLGTLYQERRHELADKLSGLADRQHWANAQATMRYFATSNNEQLAARWCDFQVRCTERMRQDARDLSDRLRIAVQDPQMRDRALEAALFTLEVYENRAEYTTTGLKVVLQNVSVTTREGERMNAEEFLRREIVRSCPFLAGTTIAEDPVRCLTYGVIYKDRDFLLNDLKVWPSPQGSLSANEALAAALHADPARTMDALDRLEAWSVLTSPEASAEDAARAVATLSGSPPRVTTPSV